MGRMSLPATDGDLGSTVTGSLGPGISNFSGAMTSLEAAAGDGGADDCSEDDVAASCPAGVGGGASVTLCTLKQRLRCLRPAGKL